MIQTEREKKERRDSDICDVSMPFASSARKDFVALHRQNGKREERMKKVQKQYFMHFLLVFLACYFNWPQRELRHDKLSVQDKKRAKIAYKTSLDDSRWELGQVKKGRKVVGTRGRCKMKFFLSWRFKSRSKPNWISKHVHLKSLD